jgi:hypothetical protein
VTARIPQLLRASIIWIVLAAAVGATLYGLLTFGMWRQHLWSGTGLYRLRFVALTYAAITTGLILFVRRWAILLFAAVLALVGLFALGPLPVIAVLLFFFSGHVLGLIALPASVPLGYAAQPIRILVGVAFYMSLIGALAHFRANYQSVYWFILFLPLALRPAAAVEAFDHWRRALTFEPATRADFFSLALLGLPLFTALATTNRPAVGSDVVGMHLRVPVWIATHHQWPFDFVQTAWALNPLGADWCFSAAYLLSGEYGTKLLDFGFFLLMVSMACLALRETGVSVFRACLFGTLLACTPMAQDLATSLMIETVQATLLLAAFLAVCAYHRYHNTHSFFAAFVLMGASLNTKFGSFAFVLPLVAIAIFLLLRRESSSVRSHGTQFRDLTAAVALLLFFGIGPYLYAYVKTGNPIFPYMNDVFKSSYFPTGYRLGRVYEYPIFDWLLPYRFVFQSQNYGRFQNGSLGFHWMIVIALIVISIWGYKSFLVRSAVAVSLFASMLVLPSTANLRYVYPAFPLLIIAGAASIQFVGSFSRAASFMVSLCLSLSIPLNFYFFPAAGWAKSNFFVNPWKASDRERYIKDVEPVREIVHYLNQHYRGLPVAFFQTPAIAELDALAYTDGWHNQTYAGAILAETDPAQCGRYLLGHGLRLFVAPVTWASEPNASALSTFLALYTQREYSYAGFELRSLRLDAPELWAKAPPHPLPDCAPTFVDDQDPVVRYTGSWHQLNNFGSPCSATLSFTNVPGNSASLTFDGTAVTFFFTRTRGRGIAEVFIDGISKGRVDEYGPGISWRSSVSYSGLTSGQHTIQVRALGMNSAGSSDTGIDVDGFSVRVSQ